MSVATPADASPELSFHPLADLFPLMEGAEFDALVADITANGLRESIVLLDEKILDGRNRYRACLAAKVEPSFEKHLSAHHSTAEALAFIISKNIHRRHLTADQKRDLIAKLLKATPEKSDRQIAKTVKADHKTVGAVRKAKEATGEISPVDKRVGADGKARKKATKPIPSEAEVSGSDEGDPGVASPDEIKRNIFDTIERHRAVARAYKKVLAVSTLDQAEKDEVSAAIGTLINHLAILAKGTSRPQGATLTGARHRQRPEAQIQRALVEHLRLRAKPTVLWLHVPNGGRRDKITGMQLKRLGTLAGASDLLLWHQGNSFALELKAQGGRLSESQLEFLARFNDAGGDTAVAEGIARALECLEGWGLLRGRAS
jgi:ParB-like chromosome segregation protein Spo0J